MTSVPLMQATHQVLILRVPKRVYITRGLGDKRSLNKGAGPAVPGIVDRAEIP